MSFSLNVANLSYSPPTNVVRILETVKEGVVDKLPKRIQDRIPQFVSDSSLHAQLHNVSFKAAAGEVTAIISTSLPERKSLSDLIINRCQYGTFDGDVSLRNAPRNTTFDNNCAFVHRKVVFVPGLTYIQLLRYAARLRMRTVRSVEIEARVEQVLKIMDIYHCKDRRIVESPPTRGAQGGELRRLSIACEIVNLPPLLVFEDPTLSLESAVAVSIMQCLQGLAKAGHAVVCTMPKPSPQIFSLIDNLVVISKGYSIFASSPSNIERFFCSPEMGYVRPQETHPVDFIFDIANGTERPTTQRSTDLPPVLQEKFQESSFFNGSVFNNDPDTASEGTLTTIRGLPEVSYFHTVLAGKAGDGNVCSNMVWYFNRVYVTIERAVYVKARDFELLKRIWMSSCLVGTVVGYLQFHCGQYGYYTTTLLKLPYTDTANSTAVLFFLSAFTFAQQALNCQIITQSLQMFRYEQFSGWCPTFGYMLSILLADIPVMIISTWLFTSIVYFMTEMNYGMSNYFFFLYTLELNSLIGLATAYLLATILKKEIPVRDTYFLVSFLCICLSGFPFQLPFIRSSFMDLSVIVPMRWTFEALMSFKFSSYEDGIAYLTPFSFEAFRKEAVFSIHGHFLAFAASLAFLLMLPSPYFLFRNRGSVQMSTRSQSRDSDFGDEAGASSKVLAPPPATTLQRPLLFNRETSITAKSQLSISVSQTSATPFATNAHEGHGPTVTFTNLTYRIKDSFAPMGVKNVLANVSGQFDWGKLSMVLGASQSGRSSLLHILAGDVGFQSEVTGEITYNDAPVDPKLPLWERCAFVEANDEQMRDITVLDTITYAMKLRCSKFSFLSIVDANVQKTVDLLHLGDVLKKKVKNLSNGERRRLSIAEEIVAGPTLLLIDEPTTNLDLHDESVMMQVFREMVNQDRTVVAAMHHPSQQTFKLFDHLILLAKGQVIYSGPCSEAVRYFTSLPDAYSLESFKNPADFLVDISGEFMANTKGEIVTPSVLASYHIDRKLGKATPSAVAIPVFSPMLENNKQDDLESSQNRQISSNNSMELERVRDPSRLSMQVITAPAVIFPALLVALLVGVKDFFVGLANTNWEHTYIRINVILTRSFFSLYYRKKLVFGSLLLHLLIACFLGWVLGSSSENVYNLTSFFAISTLLLYFANLQNIYYLFTTHQVFLKEHSRGLYSTILYWMYSQLPMYSIRVTGAIIFAVVSYALLVLGLDSMTERYFLSISILTVLGGHLVAEWICFSIKQIRDAYLTIPAIYFLFFAFSGLFIKPSTLPDWVAPWAPSISLIRWTMQADFINYFNGSPALPVIAIPGGINTYNQFLTLFGWGGKTKIYCMGMIVVNIVIFKLLSLVAAGYTSIEQKGGRKFKRRQDE